MFQSQILPRGFLFESQTGIQSFIHLAQHTCLTGSGTERFAVANWEWPAESGSWDVSMLREVFDEASVQQVQQVELTDCRRSDYPVWTLDPHGLFSVKSAYTVATCSESHGETVGSSEKTQNQRMWRKVWKLKIPNKDLTCELSALWAVTCWAIWHARNKFIHENMLLPPQQTLDMATRLLRDYQIVQSGQQMISSGVR
uniref:Reverse transcriptase zinc-binding domain-containing protein n=1 Tax=Fagus sylvatica TaxID=28930 RepID=A0A2N9H1D8_FAGSY